MASMKTVYLCRGLPTFYNFRYLSRISNVQKLLFSTSNAVACTKSTPVKFTTNKAADIPIKETIGLGRPVGEERHPLEKYVILVSFAVFLIYFCILREENDIDELIKNPEASNSKAVELIKLKTKLIYCQNNNLPTQALRARIEELEKNKQYVSPFRK